jgi:predicted DNA-binding protein (MmcQ/YjbR family)
VDDLIELLRQRCLEKPAVTIRSEDRDEFRILDGSLDLFVRLFLDEPTPVLMIRCGDALRKKMAGSSAVSVSERMRWQTKDWKWTDVVLDGSIPPEVLLKLIDHSYQLLHDALDDDERLRISMLARGLGPAEILSESIASQGLEDRRPEIETLLRPAFLLRTAKGDGPDVPTGRTKIGGEPDLPEGQAWPAYRDGKPLAFLAQVNLSELPDGVDRGGLPARGLLSFFSAWGWQDEGDADPHPPQGQPAFDWTCVMLLEDVGRLRRHRKPEGVNGFPAAAAVPVPIVCFPNDQREPAVAALGWDEETWEKFSTVVNSYNAVRNHQLGYPARNLVLGYADYEQNFVEQVAARDLQLLFQLASDDNASMCWGDGGFIYFWADPRDIAGGDFTKIDTDSQGG